MNRTLRSFAGPAGAVLLILALMSGAMMVAGTTPVEGFSALFAGSLGGRNQLGETLVATTALLFPALGIALAFRAGLFNIGAEGQLLAGAFFAGVAGPMLQMPPALGIIVLFLLAAIGGGLWGGIAGWMKARFNANEIISTLMLNFVAAYVTLDLVSGPLRGPEASGAETAWLPAAYWLPTLIPHTRLSIAILIALAVAVALYFLLSRTVFGYELRAAGDAPEAARRNGVNIARMTWLPLALSGAIAGLGGARSSRVSSTASTRSSHRVTASPRLRSHSSATCIRCGSAWRHSASAFSRRAACRCRRARKFRRTRST